MSDTTNLTAAWDARVVDLTGKMPEWLASAVAWLRKPSHRIVRVISAFLLILGGVFSILPVLGLWMLPLGLGLMAEDMPGMKPGLERSAVWLGAKCRRVKARWRMFRGKRHQP